MGYQRGEEVLRCQPYSYVIYSNFRSTVCDFCLKFKTDQKIKRVILYLTSERNSYGAVYLRWFDGEAKQFN